MRVEADNDNFRISYQRGDSSTLVVAFTGIGHGLGGIQTEEFRNSLSQAGDMASPQVAYVIDKRRLWYNNGMADDIVRVLNDIVERENSTRVATLGNSMGGFGAIVFARRLSNCIQAIAFCPQSSVNADIAPFEDRWPEWRAGVSAWSVLDATLECDARVRYDVFYGMDDPIDMQHAGRFRSMEASNVTVHLVKDCSHDVAGFLKKRGELGAILGRLIWP
ncbi:MAG: alpha/beta hydrolase [Acetobacteraceae bacterium]